MSGSCAVQVLVRFLLNRTSSMRLLALPGTSNEFESKIMPGIRVKNPKAYVVRTAHSDTITVQQSIAVSFKRKEDSDSFRQFIDNSGTVALCYHIFHIHAVVSPQTATITPEKPFRISPMCHIFMSGYLRK